MKITKVQYTVKQEYVEENKRKINAVMQELRHSGNSNVKYFASLLEDGKSFMHIVIRSDGDDGSLPGNLESFKTFQTALKENLEVPPKVENFEVVDSSFDIF